MPLMAQVHSPENGAKNVQDLSYLPDVFFLDGENTWKVGM